MADVGHIRRLMFSIKDETTRRAMTEAFEYILGNLNFGAPDHQVRAGNFQAYWQHSTTAAASTSEASFLHGLTSAPRYAIPALELDRVGAKIAPLEVSRIADSARVYLKSTSTSAPILLLIG